jgi:hypothetical protein
MGILAGQSLFWLQTKLRKRMVAMTWNDLAEQIGNMTSEQRGTDVTVYLKDKDETYPVRKFVTKWGEDEEDEVGGVLDDDHPYLKVLA